MKKDRTPKEVYEPTPPTTPVRQPKRWHQYLRPYLPHVVWGLLGVCILLVLFSAFCRGG